MKPLTFLVAAVLSAAFGVSADQPQAQVTGVVRSAKSGEPLQSAAILLAPAGAGKKTFRTTSGADGSFAFSGLAPGQYQLTIRKSGYQGFQSSVPIMILRDSSEVSRLTPALLPDGAIAGRVADWDGEPVSEAEVRAYAVVYEVAGATLSLAAKAESDDQGEYRLFDLPAGKYVIQVSPPRAATASAQFYAVTPAVYYPGARTPAQALLIELNWGEEVTGADVKLSQAQSYSISGVIWDALSEGPCTRCTVQAVQNDGVYRISLPQSARVSRDGSFVLPGLSPGDYTLVAQQGGSKGALAQTQASIRNRAVDAARLIVGLQQWVTGEIVLENPPDGIDIASSIPRLSPVAMPLWWSQAEGKVDAGKQFLIGNVPSGQYRFELAGLPPGAYLKALRWSEQTFVNAEIVVTADSPLSGLQAVVGFDGATVQGRVRSAGSAENAQPVQARVYLLPQQDRAAFHFADTAPDGSFRFDSVPPDSYTVYAIPATSSLQVFDPLVRAVLARYAQQVDLRPKQTATIEVSLTPISR